MCLEKSRRKPVSLTLNVWSMIKEMISFDEGKKTEVVEQSSLYLTNIYSAFDPLMIKAWAPTDRKRQMKTNKGLQVN